MTLSWNRALLGGLVAVLVAALSTGCSDKQPDGNDAGTTAADSGSPPQNDGGTGDLDAGAPDGDGGSSNPGIGEPGSMCNSDSDCASLICLSSGVCSLTCEANSNCPNDSWQCGNDGSRTGICVCAQTEGGDDICDGVDNDCNGTIDDRETAVCPGRRTCYMGECTCAPEDTCDLECVDKQTNLKHCGNCNNPCGEGSVCQTGNCVCNGQICGSACVDTTSDNLNCNGCNNACSLNDDCAQSACVPADREWARWKVNQGFFQGASNDEVIDFDTHLVWKKDHEAGVYTQTQAIAQCASLPHPSDSAWRVPTRAELLSIVDYDRVLGGGDAAISPGFTLKTTNPPNPIPVWTSTVVADGTNSRYWTINFVDGLLNTPTTSAVAYVRCVRQNLE